MDKKPALEAALVEEFVAKSHGDLDRVKELLAQEPGFVNATWDWGGGDFETALGAASHMGRKDIANYLLDPAQEWTFLRQPCWVNRKSSMPQ